MRLIDPAALSVVLELTIEDTKRRRRSSEGPATILATKARLNRCPAVIGIYAGCSLEVVHRRIASEAGRYVIGVARADEAPSAPDEARARETDVTSGVKQWFTIKERLPARRAGRDA
jgi:hypothetical protein